MLDDERFGLPLSLGEALRADPSCEAAQLAQLLEEVERPRPNEATPPGQHRGRRDPAWRNVMAGLALATALGATSHAATPAMTPGLQGSWTMAPAQSSFREAITGPAPDHATMTVSRDDADHLTYELVERRDGAEVARGAYALSFGGAASITRVDGEALQVTASRDADGEVVIQAPPVGALRAVIRVRRTGPDTAVLEHDVEDGGHAIEVERISLVRAGVM